MKESRKIAEGLALLETVIFLDSEGAQRPLISFSFVLALRSAVRLEPSSQKSQCLSAFSPFESCFSFLFDPSFFEVSEVLSFLFLPVTRAF